METRIKTEVSSLVQRIQSVEGKPFWPDETVTSSVLNVILRILVGSSFDKETLKDIISSIHSFVHDTVAAVGVHFCPVLRYWPPYWRVLMRAIDYHNRIFEHVAKLISSCTSDSFIKYYVDREASELDSEQLNYVVRDLLLAGTETSASMLLWSVAVLANHPSVQTKMQQEIDSVLPQRRLPSLSDKPHLPYVEATMLEIMRFKTVVPLALAHRTVSDTKVGEFIIPADTLVTTVSMY